MRRLANYFLRGLLITAPVAVTGYLCWIAIRWIDQLLGTKIPGLGLVIALGVVTLVGALASNFLTRTFLEAAEQLLDKLPFVRLLYSSVKDLLNAFVGEQRRFNRPVRVQLTEPDSVSVLGFVTADAIDHLGLAGHVAVYLPFSYSVAGHLIIVPANRVTTLPVESADAMAFILSGGVTRTASLSRKK